MSATLPFAMIGPILPPHREVEIGEDDFYERNLRVEREVPSAIGDTSPVADQARVGHLR